MFFHISSQKTNIHCFYDFLHRYHLLNKTVGTVLSIGLSFKTDSMEQSVAMGALERKFILSYNFSLIEADTLRFVLETVAKLSLFIRLLISRTSNNFKIKSLSRLILHHIMCCAYSFTLYCDSSLSLRSIVHDDILDVFVFFNTFFYWLHE